MANCSYKLIAIDLDGTLLGADGLVSETNTGAIARAQLAGIRVVPCTGRAWREAQNAVGSFCLHDQNPMGVFVTGAAVTDLRTGDSHDLAVIERHTALRLVDYLFDLPEAVLVLTESTLTGFDYLICGNGELTHNTQRWFQANRAKVQLVKHPSLDDLHHTLRVGIVGETPRVEQIAAEVREAFGDEVLLHHFRAAEIAPSRTSMDVLEIFAAGVDKWRGLDWVMQQDNIEPHQVAVIGDEINDIAALTAAGCGIAMGNAADDIKALANHVTLDNADHGVAHAIDQLLTGAW